jgi:hypothetical protein
MLAKRYANGTLPQEWTLDAVAHELALVQYLHDCTNYKSTIEQRLRDIANDMKKEFTRLTWKQVWGIVRLYGPDIVKMEAIETLENKRVPIYYTS